jgi:hypothetical protein
MQNKFEKISISTPLHGNSRLCMDVHVSQKVAERIVNEWLRENKQLLNSHAKNLALTIFNSQINSLVNKILVIELTQIIQQTLRRADLRKQITQSAINEIAKLAIEFDSNKP